MKGGRRMVSTSDQNEGSDKGVAGRLEGDVHGNSTTGQKDDKKYKI